MTLKVGDYILSKTLFVERKCISDLFSSILHGRLYDQILQITRYYEIPILLIEIIMSFAVYNNNERIICIMSTVAVAIKNTDSAHT